MRARRTVLIAAMCGVLGLAVPSVAGSASPPVQVVSDPAIPAVATLLVQAVPVLRLRGANAEARAGLVARRLTEILAGGAPPFVVTVAPREASADLLLNGRHLASVDPPQARAAGTTVPGLARGWADRLRRALSRNTVTLTPAVLLLRPGEMAAVTVAAFLPGPMTIGPYDDRVASARPSGGVLSSERGGTVTVEARAFGATTVPVIVGGGQALLQVIVRRPAGVIPDSVTVRLTGDLGNIALVREAVQRRLEQAVMKEPGATLTLGPVLLDEALLASDPPVLWVPVRLRSPYALPVEADVRVTVVRERVEVQDPATLLVSNRPEAVLADGVLFEEVVEGGRPTRLLYHHQNGTPDRPRVLTIALTNRGERSADLLLISGLAGPSADSLFVGLAATSRFLQNLAAARGYVLEIPPRSTYAFTAQTMAPLQLVSGILQFQLLTGEQLDVRIATRLPWILDRTVAIPVNQIAYPHPKGLFAGPTVEVVRTVDVTAAAALVDLGWAAALRDPRTGEPLVGDYGVVYRLTITAANPLAQELRADLVATAAGGAARGVFLIDGRLVEIAIYRGFEERTLATLSVPARQQVTTQILTMPAAGSYYPVRLSLRPQP